MLCLPALQVIPQLIARIDTPRPLVGRLIHQLLTDIGRYHPQVRADPKHFLMEPRTDHRFGGLFKCSLFA